jgi:hypothetical protein
MAEAREHDPELKVAMGILNAIGVSTSLYSYLPSEVRSLAIDPKAAIEDKIRDKIPGRGKFGLPF